MRAFIAQHLILVLPAYIHKTTHYGAEHFYRRTAPVYAHVVLAVCGKSAQYNYFTVRIEAVIL